MRQRVSYYGGTDQWTRMREDKLKALRKALLYSYQAAVVRLKNKYYDPEAEEGTYESYPFVEFRCLINHDKLKVAYEDKIISIPFEDVCLTLNNETLDRASKNYFKTGITTGDVFTWVSGNEGFIEDTYWLIYLQYSEETAYFRAEIREAKDTIGLADEDGSLLEDADGNPLLYHGYTTGPNETSIFWNVKKGVVWNELNYTKLLYITKDEVTTDFFKRFDMIKLAADYEKDENGNYVHNEQGFRVPTVYNNWEVQAVNTDYGDGMIRVALKEAYTNTASENAAAERKTEEAAAAQEIEDYRTENNITATIEGNTEVYVYDTVDYTISEPIENAVWSISNSDLVTIKNSNVNSVSLYIKKRDVNNKTFTLYYGVEGQPRVSLNIKILSF